MDLEPDPAPPRVLKSMQKDDLEVVVAFVGLGLGQVGAERRQNQPQNRPYLLEFELLWQE